MDDIKLGHAAFHPFGQAEGITPRHLREAGNLPAPVKPNEQLETMLKNARKFGLLLVSLEGLRWQVDEATRLKIEAILKDVNA